MKKYKPKKWFIYTRLALVFMIVFAFGKTTDTVYSKLSTTNENENKKLSQAVIIDNKEEIYIEENPALNKYISLPEKGFEVTVDNKKYELNEEDYILLVAVVSAESNAFKDDMLAVMSVILNRADKTDTTPIDVITRKGQFAGYFNDHYLKYMNEDGSLKERTLMTQEVVTDALNGVRNNKYYSFRSWGTTTYSDNYIVERGNRFN